MIQTPRYISDKPKGKDKFDGGSQSSLSKAIVQHILRNDNPNSIESLPRIIGIEGTWGSGKSNVVRMVENDLIKNHPHNYYFFEYDAWGNQEDLQRRSLLEQLTSNLVNKKVLIGETEITIKGGETKTVSWEEKLKLLLARKTETTSESYPRISNGMIAGAVTTILTSISSLIALLLAEPCGWYSLIIALLPIISTFIVWGIAACRNENYRNLSYLLAIYNDKVNKETQFELISEDEPSVVEFKNWMKDVSDNLNSKVCNKLVIVFDNMDRLPADKVKQLWSSIHTFFAETGFDNVWVIIPYDESHLSCAFGDGDDKLSLTRYFINKTFPVTFSVPKPVITDYKGIFSKLFVEAFGEGCKYEDLINRIYRLNRTEPNVRDIIIFINNLVSLFYVWYEQISLVNMAIFVIHKDEILKNPIEQILSCGYLKLEKSVIEDTEEYKSEIAALTYGINKEIAEQIPLTEYITRCIDSVDGYDINLYANEDPNFDPILKEVVIVTDSAKNANLVKCLGTLNKVSDDIKQLWEDVAKRLLKQDVTEQTLPEEYKTAITHVSKDTCQNLVNKLCKAWRNSKNFNGATYVKCLNSLDLVQGVEFEIPHPNIEVKPDAFIDAVSTQINSYKSYNLCCAPEQVDDYVSGKIPNEMNCADAVCKLYSDGFSNFNTTNNKISETIRGNAIDLNNLWPICKIYRCINSGVVPELIDDSTLQSLLSELTNNEKIKLEDGYIDLLAISVAKHRSVVVEDLYIAQVSEIIDSYIDFGDLIVKNLRWNDHSANKVVKYMIENDLGNVLDLDEVLPKFTEIRDHYSVSEIELLANLNSWAEDYQITSSPKEIQTLIPSAEIYKFTSELPNNLSRIINRHAYDAISTRTCQQFIDAERSHQNDYWHQMYAALMNDESMQNRPQCIIEYAGLLYKQLATGIKPISGNEYYVNLSQSVSPSLISHRFSEIRDSFCNGQSNISIETFKFCENNLVKYGQLKDRATDVVDRIIKPIISYEEVKNLILNNKDFYRQLFNAAGLIVDFKNQVKKHWQGEIELLDLLNIKIENAEHD